MIRHGHFIKSRDDREMEDAMRIKLYGDGLRHEGSLSAQMRYNECRLPTKLFRNAALPRINEKSVTYARNFFE